MEEIIKKMLILWDPLDLISFPANEYDSYATSIFEFTCNAIKLTKDVLADFVYSLFQEAMCEKNSKKSKYIFLNGLEKSGCIKFSELYFSIIKQINRI